MFCFLGCRHFYFSLPSSYILGILKRTPLVSKRFSRYFLFPENFLSPYNLTVAKLPSKTSFLQHFYCAIIPHPLSPQTAQLPQHLQESANWHETQYNGKRVITGSFPLAGSEITFNYRSWHACKRPSLGQALRRCSPWGPTAVTSFIRLLPFLCMSTEDQKLTNKSSRMCFRVLVPCFVHACHWVYAVLFISLHVLPWKTCFVHEEYFYSVHAGEN